VFFASNYFGNSRRQTERPLLPNGLRAFFSTLGLRFFDFNMPLGSHFGRFFRVFSTFWVPPLIGQKVLFWGGGGIFVFFSVFLGFFRVLGGSYTAKPPFLAKKGVFGRFIREEGG
jgi:hypothetical protein